MSERIDDLAERVHSLEIKMDQVPATIDQRFDAVDAAIAEQRRYTEFAFDRVRAELAEVKTEVLGAVNAGLGRPERKLDQFVDRHLQPTPSDEQPKEPPEHSRYSRRGAFRASSSKIFNSTVTRGAASAGRRNTANRSLSGARSMLE